MYKINEAFKGIGEKMPFAQEFFTRDLQIGSFAINMLLLIAVVIVVVLLLVIILLAMNKLKKTKEKDSEDTVTKSYGDEDAYILGETKTHDNYMKKETVEKKKESTPSTVDNHSKINEEAKAQPTATKKANATTGNAQQKETTSGENKALGKYEIVLKLDGYHFYLLANNGQLLYESVGYTTAQGAMRGIETFIRNVANENFVINKDKFGRYRYILNKRYVGENYNSKASCGNSIKSVRYFYLGASIVPYEYDEMAEKAYEEEKSKNVNIEIDWKKIAREEKIAKPSGKFEIEDTNNGFQFYMLANNGQLLYSSTCYSSLDTARNGITNFKKAVYIGNFFVDEDKFGKYRFVLRGTNAKTTYIGESYTTKGACENIIESVKSFNKTATLVPYEKEK